MHDLFVHIGEYRQNGRKDYFKSPFRGFRGRKGRTAEKSISSPHSGDLGAKEAEQKKLLCGTTEGRG